MKEDKIIKHINLTDKKIGDARREESYKEIGYDTAFLPKAVDYNDIIKSFIEFVNKEINLEHIKQSNNEKTKVKVYPFEGLKKFTEFMKTWSTSDEYGDVKLPFITIIRKPNVQEGTNNSGQWNIPGFPTFNYIKIPTINNGIEGNDLYKIPVPINVDFEFTVRLFSSNIELINSFNQKIIELFSSRQFYIFPNGYPMAMILEDIGDESKYDLESRKYYVQPVVVKLMGYTIPKDKFEIVPTVNKLSVSFSVDTDVDYKISKNLIKLDFNDDNTFSSNFYYKGLTTINSVVATKDLILNSITDLTNINTYKLYIKNILIENPTFPINVNRGSRIKIEITKPYSDKNSYLNLNGNY